jgi:Raf kinase inhibitor-like YbhB/YbcL family protein
MSKRFIWGMAVMLLAGAGQAKQVQASGKAKKIHLSLQSSSFQDGGVIPDKFACKGKDLSPELNWKNAPEKTKSFALVVEDPDAPLKTWVHWVIFNIPAKVSGLSGSPMGQTHELLEDFPRDEKTPEGIQQGVNDFKKVGYDGPCPPAKETHRYYFKLFALDSMLLAPAGISEEQLLKLIKGHQLAWTQIMGTYGR